jgi:prepilin-type N-terminal cleavage/methylation domain-containing protein
MSNIKNKHTNRLETGFTLIELAVVLVIIAILLSGGIEFRAGYIRNKNIALTNQRIENIAAHLNYFIGKYKRLPCPTLAGGGANYVYPNYDTANNAYGYERVGTFCENPGNSVQAMGEVPWLSLGIPESMVKDGWGNKFMYRVDPSLTIPEIVGTTNGGMDFRSFEINTVDDDKNYEESLQGKGIFVCQIDDSDGKNPDFRRPDEGTGAAYVIISNGEQAFASAQAYEKTNHRTVGIIEIGSGNQGYQTQSISPTFGEFCFVSAPYIDTTTGTGAAGTFFDDIIFAPKLSVILSETHMEPE